MKKIYTLITLTFLLLSCEKQGLSYPGMEVVVFYPDTPETYLWSDLENPAMGWEEKQNGKDFTFITSGNKLKITSQREIKQSLILKDNSFAAFDLSAGAIVTEKMTFRFRME